MSVFLHHIFGFTSEAQWWLQVKRSKDWKRKKQRLFLISQKKKKKKDIFRWSLDVWCKCINNSGFSKARGLGCPHVALLRIVICSVSLLSIWEEKLALWRNVAHTLLIEHERKGSSCQGIPYVRWNLLQQIWWQAFFWKLERKRR